MIEEYYPDPTFYSYLYIRQQYEKDKNINLNQVPKDHLKNLEISGFLKFVDGKLVLKEGERWLCDPPEIKVRPKKEPYFDRRIEILAKIVGYPLDWHNKNKYKSLFNSLNKSYEWSTIKVVAEFWSKNKEDSDLRINYFLTKSAFDSIKYLMENPPATKQKKKEYKFRGIVDDLDEGQECPF